MPAVFAAHTTTAALLALSVAVGLDLPHPWWAAMTIWLVAQPTRGLFIERCAARLLGTAAGAVVGAAAALAFAHDRVILLAALAAWLMLCAAAGAALRHFRSYAAVLAGYTASIVALFGYAEGDFSLFQAGARVACTLIGIGVSALVSAVFLKPGGSGAIALALRTLEERCARWSRQPAATRRTGPARQKAAVLARDVARFERSLEDNAAGSLAARRTLGAVRSRLEVVLEILATSSLVDQPAMQGEADFPGSAGFAGAALARHAAMMRAAARPAAALGMAALLWLATGWPEGPIAVMTAAIFASLFSSHERARDALKGVMQGSAIGAVAGLGFRVLVTPHLAGLPSLILALAPFLAGGAFLMARPATARMAIDINMTFLLVAQPGLDLPPATAEAARQAAAMLAGIGCAWLTYTALLPTLWERDLLYRGARMRQLADSLCRMPPAARQARERREMTQVVLSICCDGRTPASVCMAALAVAGRAAQLEAEQQAELLMRAVATLSNLIKSTTKKSEF